MLTYISNVSCIVIENFEQIGKWTKKLNSLQNRN